MYPSSHPQQQQPSRNYP